MSPSFPTATRPNPPTQRVSFPACRLHGSRTFSSFDCHIRLHVFLLFYYGLKSPGINSTLPPGSALCRYLTGPFLLFLCKLDVLYFCLFLSMLPDPVAAPLWHSYTTVFWTLFEPQVVIGGTPCVAERFHMVPQKYKIFWLRKHVPHLFLVRYNKKPVNLYRDYEWNSKLF